MIESGSRQSIFGGYVFRRPSHVRRRLRRRALRRQRREEAARTGRDPPFGSDLNAAICAGSERAFGLGAEHRHDGEARRLLDDLLNWGITGTPQTSAF